MKDCQHMLELEDGQELTLYEEDCPHCLRATIEAKDADLTAMTSRYSRAAADIASLELELAAITHVAMTADPAGWWIAPRGSSDPSEWICVEEMTGDMDRARLVMRKR